MIRDFYIQQISYMNDFDFMDTVEHMLFGNEYKCNEFTELVLSIRDSFNSSKWLSLKQRSALTNHIIKNELYPDD